MKVLVADDDRIAATVLSQTLKQWEFDVTVVSDGAEALGTSRAATVRADARDPRLDDARTSTARMSAAACASRCRSRTCT